MVDDQFAKWPKWFKCYCGTGRAWWQADQRRYMCNAGCGVSMIPDMSLKLTARACFGAEAARYRLSEKCRKAASVWPPSGRATRARSVAEAEIQAGADDVDVQVTEGEILDAGRHRVAELPSTPNPKTKSDSVPSTLMLAPGTLSC